MKLSPRGAATEDSPPVAGDAWHQLYGAFGSIEDRFPHVTGQARLSYVLQVYGKGGAARDIVLFEGNEKKVRRHSTNQRPLVQKAKEYL